MVKAILDAAIAGDIQACKIVLDRLLPPLKATAQSILPARLKARLRASLRIFAQAPPCIPVSDLLDSTYHPAVAG